MRRSNGVLQSIIVLAGIVLIGGLIGWLIISGFRKPSRPIPPELQRQMEVLKKIEIEMSEEEVDAILADYRSSSWTYERNKSTAGKPLVRTALYTKMYSERGEIEGDFVILVYFDEAYRGRAVGKELAGLDH